MGLFLFYGLTDHQIKRECHEVCAPPTSWMIWIPMCYRVSTSDLTCSMLSRLKCGQRYLLSVDFPSPLLLSLGSLFVSINSGLMQTFTKLQNGESPYHVLAAKARRQYGFLFWSMQEETFNTFPSLYQRTGHSQGKTVFCLCPLAYNEEYVSSWAKYHLKIEILIQMCCDFLQWYSHW